MSQLLPPKKEVALALLERSNVDVYLDPRARGVVVPPQFRKEPRLILKIGLNMPVPIPDLRLDEESMSCTLSFNRSPFYCVVPWSSVFAMVGEDGRGMVWPDDVPQELAVKVVEPSRSDATSPSPERSAGNGRRAVRGSKLAEDTSSPSAAGRGTKKKKSKKDEAAPRPMLMVVPPVPAQQRPSEEAAGNARSPERRDGVSAIPSAQSSRGTPHSSRIPPSSPDRADRDRRDRRDRLDRAPGSPPPPASPPPPGSARPDGVRPKRELPPYLRVVK